MEPQSQEIILLVNIQLCILIINVIRPVPTPAQVGDSASWATGDISVFPIAIAVLELEVNYNYTRLQNSL